MLPTVEQAKQELEFAAELNPGPWIRHSLNVGVADHIAVPAALEAC